MTRRSGVAALLAAGALLLMGATAKPAKIEAMAQAILTAASLAEVRAAYKRLQIGPSDLGALGKRMADPQVKGRLASLVEEARKRSKAAAPASLPGAETRLVQGQQAEVAELNRRARARFSSPRQAGAPGPGASSGQPWTQEMTAALTAGTRTECPDPPRIIQVYPTIAEAGTEIRIVGTRFGSERGELSLGFREPRVAIPVDSTRWGPGEIRAGIPLSVDAFLTAGARTPAVIWVRMPGREACPAAIEFSLLPAAPRIRSLSSDFVMPGQEIVVLGELFGDRPGSAGFEIGGRSIEGRVEPAAWNDGSVRVELPEVDGLIAGSARVWIERASGRRAHHGIDFRPLLEEHTLWDRGDHGYTPGTFGPTGTREERFQLQVGMRRPLINGWVVTGAELTCGGDGTCRYEPAAVEGGGNVPHFVVLRAEPYGFVSASSSITIRGPRNTPYSSP